jgi:Uncharacterized ACR, COG1993
MCCGDQLNPPPIGDITLQSGLQFDGTACTLQALPSCVDMSGLAIRRTSTPRRSCVFHRICQSWVEIIDTQEKIDKFLPVLDNLMTSGLVTIEKVQVLQYGTETSIQT